MAHDPKLNLHQRLLKVCEEVGYIKKDVQVQGAKGVARDLVVAEVRPVLLKYGVLAMTSQVSGRLVETAQKSSSGTPLSIYVGTYVTKFINVDDPKNDVELVQHEAQGNDYGDKAPGKASTYSEKLNLVKGLLLETGIADEGRNPGEGDEEAEKSAASKDKIKTPQSKSGAEPAKKQEGPFATPESLKALTDAIAKKRVGPQVRINLQKRGIKRLEDLAEVTAKTLLDWVNKQPDPEPGQDG